MKPRFIYTGEQQLRRSPEFKAALQELRESIQERHAAEFAEAGFIRRLVLRWRITAEFRRERRMIEPSSGSLYSARILSRSLNK